MPVSGKEGCSMTEKVCNLKAYSLDIKVSRKSYTVAKAYTYGNMKSNPRRGCVASTLLRDQ